MGFDPRTCLNLLAKAEPMQSFGKVTKVVGLVAEAAGMNAALGDVCHILPDSGGEAVAAEVVGFRDGNLLFMPYGEMRGVRPGSLLRNSSLPPFFPAGPDQNPSPAPPCPAVLKGGRGEERGRRFRRRDGSCSP